MYAGFVRLSNSPACFCSLECPEKAYKFLIPSHPEKGYLVKELFQNDEIAASSVIYRFKINPGNL
jgi:hypothetical protein